MRLILWLFRASVFFVLFAFALNNQQSATVRWFFGIEWHAPMVILVLVAFAAGCTIGVLAMLPSWFRLRRDARRSLPAEPARNAAAASSTVLPSDFGPEHPPREGL